MSYTHLTAMAVFWLMASLLGAVVAHAQPAAEDDEAANVPGGIFAWPIPAGANNIRFQDKPVFTLREHALIGIPMRTPPGTLKLKYQLDDQTLVHEFAVVNKDYTEQHITIENQDLVSPPPQTQARISAEAVRQRGLYASYAFEHELKAGFEQPLEGIVTSLFGHRRFFNGQPRNPHSGLDIAADTGTPIKAAGGGQITLADDLYFNGNTIFVDHGQGLITMYCHMSKLLVREGDRVARGDVIGEVGATGRVTGPHLHWTVSLNGTRVDPQTFTRIVANLNQQDR